MKRVGIVTIIDYYNYGNRLQNYAVSYLLNNKLGCKAITLEGYRNSFIQGSFTSWIKEQIAVQLCRFPGIAEKNLNPKVIRWYNFSKWSKKWIPRKRFYACEQLPSELNDQFDLFISGSDQVWNYRIQNLRIEDFFLVFAEDRKKNSLSASFGTDQILEAEKQYYCEKLSAFSNISVRENTGAGIVKDLTGRNVPVLIDPVMMLDMNEWIKVEEKSRLEISKPYVLKYYLGDKDNTVDRWARENGYVVYELLNKKEPKLYGAGPGEFISLIRNAALVLSDSFHCIAFSILSSVPFIVYERQGKEDYMLSRLNTLLEKFGFEDRWSSQVCQEDYLNCDFEIAMNRLETERKAFWDYLKAVVYPGN